MIKAIIFDFFGVLFIDGQPNRQLLDTIQAEFKPRCKIGILSNSSGDITQLLPPPDRQLFDDATLSYEHSVAKPHPEIYKIAAKRLGVESEECIYIDDYGYRVEGAKAAGMQAILYRDFRQMKTELEKLLSASPDN